MRAFFVTATGTDIGKTFVTAGLVRLLREDGERAAALKPIVSGFAMARAGESDPGILLAALGEAMTSEAVARISPWRFSAPLSPDMAAAREGRAIDFGELVAFCRAGMAHAAGPLFIEGVGGVMVPLDDHHTVLDWMEALGLPIILVAGSYLGTFSHTLTALEAIVRRRLKLAALVVNDSGDGAVPLDETIATLARFAATAPIVALRRAKDEADIRAGFAALWHVLEAGR
ncbi:MAG: dethiobiotin synthase [Rhizomicrobium sp.]